MSNLARMSIVKRTNAHALARNLIHPQSASRLVLPLNAAKAQSRFFASKQSLSVTLDVSVLLATFLAHVESAPHFLHNGVSTSLWDLSVYQIVHYNDPYVLAMLPMAPKTPLPPSLVRTWTFTPAPLPQMKILSSAYGESTTSVHVYPGEGVCTTLQYTHPDFTVRPSSCRRAEMELDRQYFWVDGGDVLTYLTFEVNLFRPTGSGVPSLLGSLSLFRSTKINDDSIAAFDFSITLPGISGTTTHTVSPGSSNGLSCGWYRLELSLGLDDPDHTITSEVRVDCTNFTVITQEANNVYTAFIINPSFKPLSQTMQRYYPTGNSMLVSFRSPVLQQEGSILAYRLDDNFDDIFSCLPNGTAAINSVPVTPSNLYNGSQGGKFSSGLYSWQCPTVPPLRLLPSGLEAFPTDSRGAASFLVAHHGGFNGTKVALIMPSLSAAAPIRIAFDVFTLCQPREQTITGLPVSFVCSDDFQMLMVELANVPGFTENAWHDFFANVARKIGTWSSNVAAIAGKVAPVAGEVANLIDFASGLAW